MPFYKNTASQKIAVYAHDTAADAAKTGDAANITAQISLDGGVTAATNDVNPTELDAADAAGVYIFDMTQAESNADMVILATVSATADIQIEVVIIYSDPLTSIAAANLQLQYDTTGLSGDNFPAKQSQLASIANVGSAVHTPADSYTLTTGTQSSGTVTSTAALDGINHEHTDVAGAMDLYYEFLVGSGIPTSVTVTGYLNGNNDDLEVHGWDWVTSAWVQIGTLNGKAASTNEVNAFDMFINMVGSGANEGIVRVRLTDGAFTLTSATLAIDQIFLSFSRGSEGYDNGSIWIDTTLSNTNTVVGVDGTSRNPVSTIAAANTLSASTNLNRFEVAPGSSITFGASQDNQVFHGENWTLALGGQSVSGSHIIGANVSGIATGAAKPTFTRCHFGATTLPPSQLETCGLDGTITAGSAGDFFFDFCHSGIAGVSTPILDFGGALNASQVTFRHYSGGIEIQNMGAGTGTYNMSLEGDGALVINANCSATSNVRVRGSFELTDNASGAVAVTVRGDGYDGGAVWIDTNITNTNTVSYVDGTAGKPVSTIAAATTIADDLNIKKFHLVAGSSITLAQAYNFYTFDAYGATIALGGQSINGAVFIGGKINGNDDGSNSNRVRYFDCDIDGSTLGQFIACRVRLTGTLVLAEAGTYFMDQCYSGVAGATAPVIDFGALLAASNLNVRHYSGGIEIENMGAGAGTYNMTLEGNGQLIINANCSATSNIELRGNFKFTDNSGGAVTVTTDDDTTDINAILVDTGEIGTAGAGLTDLGGMSSGMKTEVNTEVLDVLNVDTFALPGQEAPTATPTIKEAITYIFKFLTNKRTDDGTNIKIFARDETTVDHKNTVSDDGSTYTHGEFGTGP